MYDKGDIMAKAKIDNFTQKEVQLSEIAKALAHPARVRILNILFENNVCITGDIVDQLPLSQSTVSQHLIELKKVGLIKGEIEGQKTCYCLDNKIVEFDSLKTTLKKLIEIYPKSTLIYVLDKDVYFEDYFKVISSYKEAIYELRDMYAISEYSAKFDEIFDYENRNEVIAKYPYNFHLSFVNWIAVYQSKRLLCVYIS